MIRLKYERLARNRTQRDVALMTGINHAFISMIEVGRLQPTQEQLTRLGQLFGVPPEHLLLDVEIVRHPSELAVTR